MFVEARLLGGVVLGRLGVNCDGGGVDRTELFAFGASGRLPRNGGKVGLEFAVLPSGRSLELSGLVRPGNGGSPDGGRLGGLEFVRPLVRGGVVCFGAELVRGVVLELPLIGGNLNCPLVGGKVRAGGGLFDPNCEGGLVDFGFC